MKSIPPALLLVALLLNLSCEQRPSEQPVPQAGSKAAESTRAVERPRAGGMVTDAAALKALFNDPAKALATAQADPIAFAWAMFLYVNWPAQAGQRGVPDWSAPFGANQPVLWETWKWTGEVYLVGGAQPDSWNSGNAAMIPVAESAQIDGTILNDAVGNAVRYEVRMNQATFQYIVANGLYSASNQVALAAKQTASVNFPVDAMEIKASWRILGATEIPTATNRYLTREILIPSNDGAGGGTTRVLAGLTGLHISSKVLPNWFWATFEQVDNESTTTAKLKLPIAPAVQAANERIRKLFAGTRWANYRLNSFQTDFVDSNGAPTLSANSQLESRFQSSSSCISCHALSSIGPSPTVRIPRFSMKPGAGVQGPVGRPNTNQFRPSGPFVPLDFVWSLSRAQ